MKNKLLWFIGLLGAMSMFFACGGPVETPDTNDNPTVAPETPDDGEQGGNTPETPDDGEQGGNTPETPDDGEQGGNTPEIPDDGEQGGNTPETPDDGEQGDETGILGALQVMPGSEDNFSVSGNVVTVKNICSVDEYKSVGWTLNGWTLADGEMISIRVINNTTGTVSVKYKAVTDAGEQYGYPDLSIEPGDTDTYTKPTGTDNYATPSSVSSIELFLGATEANGTIKIEANIYGTGNTPETPDDGEQGGNTPETPGDGEQGGNTPEVPDDGEQGGNTPEVPDDGEQGGNTPEVPDDGEQGGNTPEVPDDGEQGGNTPENPDVNVQQKQTITYVGVNGQTGEIIEIPAELKKLGGSYPTEYVVGEITTVDAMQTESVFVGLIEYLFEGYYTDESCNNVFENISEEETNPITIYVKIAVYRHTPIIER